MQINKENISNYFPDNTEETKLEKLSFYLCMDINKT